MIQRHSFSVQDLDTRLYILSSVSIKPIHTCLMLAPPPTREAITRHRQSSAWELPHSPATGRAISKALLARFSTVWTTPRGIGFTLSSFWRIQTLPSIHPAYGETWLTKLGDTVLYYNLSGTELEHVKEMEVEKGLFMEKALFDYIYVLRACYNTGAKYVAILEDDVLALDGWFHRTLEAAAVAEKQTGYMDTGKCKFPRQLSRSALIHFTKTPRPLSPPVLHRSILRLEQRRVAALSLALAAIMCLRGGHHFHPPLCAAVK